MGNYVIFHLHTMLSNGVTNIDSVTDYHQYIDQAKEWGMKAIAFSEHGSVFSWYNKKVAVEKAGLKYIHAIEAYITEHPDERIRDNYHCVLIAKNYEGFLELNRLSSKAFNRANVKTIGDTTQFYYTPRITFEELVNTSDNIIVSTACLASILNNAPDHTKERFICFLAKNKHRCFLEIQHHDVEEQIEYNQYLYELSKTINVPLIAGTDTHALNETHMKGRALLQKAKGVHFDNEDKWDLSMKSYEQLVEAYRKQNSLSEEVVLAAIEETNKLADMVEEYPIDRSYKYPHLWEDSMGTFRKKIEEGIKRRGVDKYPNYQEYLDRIEYEMEAYVHNDAIDFMLLMEDIISWCREQDIMIGYGRGSVNGSVIAWLLGITEMDSIKYHLNFDRFMNVERVSLSDIDTDFPPSRIDDVKKYIFSKHGLYCSDIITFNTIADKGTIRDVCRGLYKNTEKDYMWITNRICNSLDTPEYEKVRKEYPEVFEYMDILKGVIVSIGSHPCGTVVSPISLEDTMGLCTTSTSDYPVSQIYMKEIDAQNYVKLDLLKLDTIELIYNTCKMAGIDKITPDNIDVTDLKVWNAIRDDTTQIFQWEGTTGDKYIKKLLSDENIEKFKKVNKDIDRMTLLSIGNSAIRPAGASYRDDLANGVVRTTGSKPIDDFLSSTFGYLVFQCQIIDFLHLYCGFTMGEADIVRRQFSKKIGTETTIPIIKNGGYISEESTHYIDGYIKTMKDRYGIDESKSEEDIVAFIKVIEDASSYLFSLNHSQPYSIEGYVSGWLRTYYPLEFITAALNINEGKEEKTRGLTEYAKKCGITILPPKFGFSHAKYSCDKDSKTIYKGLSSIKFINDVIPEELYEISKENPETFADVLYLIKEKTSVNARQIGVLIKVGFFEDFGSISTLLSVTELFGEMYDKCNFAKTSKVAMAFGESIMSRYSKYIPDRVTEIDVVEYVRLKLGIDNYEEELLDCAKYGYETNEDGTKTKIFKGYSTKRAIKKYNISENEQFGFMTKGVVGKFMNADVKGLLNYWLNNKSTKDSIQEICAYQQECLGYIGYMNPKCDPRFFVVTNLDTTYAPRFIAYCIHNGKTCEMRVRKRKNPKNKKDKTVTPFTKRPFNNGDILYLKDWGREPKMIKTDDGWAEDSSTLVIWMYDYEIRNDMVC